MTHPQSYLFFKKQWDWFQSSKGRKTFELTENQKRYYEAFKKSYYLLGNQDSLTVNDLIQRSMAFGAVPDENGVVRVRFSKNKKRAVEPYCFADKWSSMPSVSGLVE